MYKSKEIRWFFKENNETITKWFSDKEKLLSKTKPRIDFYLPLPGKEDLSVKLREGNVEIKQRHGEPMLHHLTKNATGYLEDWVKWSFNVEDKDNVEGKDKEASGIIKDKNTNWIEVYKERIGIKLTKNPDGTENIVDIIERVPFGCQVEYTRILIDKKEWFTFGLEWFGDTHLDPEKEFIEWIIGETKLEEKDSLGYNEFINRLKI